jgi:hypothetical protein
MNISHLPTRQVRLQMLHLVLKIFLVVIWIEICATISEHLPRVLELDDEGLLEGLYGFSYEGLFDFFLLVVLGVLVWSMVRLVEPIRYWRIWAAIRPIVILAVWLLIVATLYLYFNHLAQQRPDLMIEHIFPPPRY